MSDSPLNLRRMRLYLICVVFCFLVLCAETASRFVTTKLVFFLKTKVKKCKKLFTPSVSAPSYLRGNSVLPPSQNRRTTGEQSERIRSGYGAESERHRCFSGAKFRVHFFALVLIIFGQSKISVYFCKLKWTSSCISSLAANKYNQILSYV